MAKTNTEGRSRNEHQFPSCILYSSPPEASSLSDWVHKVELKRNSGGSTTKGQSRTDQLNRTQQS